MEKETLATEVIKETQEKLNKVVMELECLDADFDKALFALSEIIERLDFEYPETKEDVCRLHMTQERIDTLAGIALDYIRKIQGNVSNMIEQSKI